MDGKIKQHSRSSGLWPGYLVFEWAQQTVIYDTCVPVSLVAASSSVLVCGLIPEILAQVMKEGFTGENRYYRNGISRIIVSHIWVPRRLETRNTSTDNWWVALLSFGDGWHNNHHAYPPSRPDTA